MRLIQFETEQARQNRAARIIAKSRARHLANARAWLQRMGPGNEVSHERAAAIRECIAREMKYGNLSYEEVYGARH